MYMFERMNSTTHDRLVVFEPVSFDVLINNERKDTMREVSSGSQW